MNSTRLTAVCFFLAFVLAVAFLVPPAYSEVTVYLLLLTCLTLFPLVLLRSSGRSLGTLLLLTPALLLSFDAFMLRLGWLNLFTYLDNSWAVELGQEAMRKSAYLALIGNLALWIGYFSPLSARLSRRWTRRLSARLQDQQVHPVTLRIWITFIIGICARIYLVKTGVGGYFSTEDARQEALPYVQGLNLLESLTSLSIALYFATLLRQKRGAFWPPFWIMFVIELLTVALLGFKGQLVFRFIYLAIIYAVVRRSFSWQLIGGGAALLVVIFPINLALRQSYLNGKFQAGDLSAIQNQYQSVSSQSLQNSSPEELLLAGVRGPLQNSAQFEPFAMVVQYVDRTGTYFYGAEYLYFIYAYIPRALWPEKPSPKFGNWVYTVVYGRPGDISFAQTVPGNFYLNLGIPGVIGGMFFFGVMSCIFGNLILQITSLRYLPLVPIVVIGLGMPISDIGSHLTWLSQILILSTTALHLMAPRNSKQLASKPSRVLTPAHKIA